VNEWIIRKCFIEPALSQAFGMMGNYRKILNQSSLQTINDTHV
jgi:hypothetical protein